MSKRGASPTSPDKVPFYKKTRHTSKFQSHGQALQKDLQNLLNTEDPRVYKSQIQAVLNTRQLLESDPTNSDPALIVAPTGSGKSGMIALLPYILQSERVLVITPSSVILDQLAVAFGHNPEQESFLEVCFGVGLPQHEKNELKEVLEPVTIIRDSSQITSEPTGNLFIANAQKFGGKSHGTLNPIYGDAESIQEVRKFFDNFDTLIVDEAHHFPAATWKNIVNCFKNSERKKIIFLTATPYRKVGGQSELILANQRIAYTIERRDLEGNIIRPVNFIEKTGYTGIKDYRILVRDIQEIRRRQNREERRIDHQAIICVQTITETEDLVRRLNLAGRSHKYAITDTGSNFAVAIFSSATKDKDITDFTKGTYKVAVICGSLKEGYDNPNVSLCVILKRIRSELGFSQFVGRSIRMKKFKKGEEKDKTHAQILSYSCFSQTTMWMGYDNLADNDPTDDDDE